MRELAVNWYVILSALNAGVSAPLGALADGIGLPLVSALLFGLIGTTAPCQLTTNAGALAFIVRDAGDRRRVVWSTLAYLAGKVAVYTVIGVIVILAGQELARNSIPVITVVRQVVGPLMIVLGLYLLGLLPLRFSVGRGLADWLEARAGGGIGGALLLGIAFAFAFCPTLFLLFFGLTIPLALRSPVGVVYPGLFALGTALPLLGLAGLLTAGVGATKGYLSGVRHLNAWIRPIAGIVLILAGVNDTVTYWFL